jgi:hypothetical protein
MVSNAKLIEVIQVHTTIGKGIEGDPVRLLIQYWSKDGELLVERDEWKDGE